MPLLRLVAEGVGPFERLDIDLSDGNGNPHLGPHIFAGVNGSGKSTVLRTLAWVMDVRGAGFPYDQWAHLTAGYVHSGTLLVIEPPGWPTYVCGCYKGAADEAQEWARSAWAATGLDPQRFGAQIVETSQGATQRTTRIAWLQNSRAYPGIMFNIAAYSPSRALRHIDTVDLTRRLSTAHENALAFEGTVQNELVQSWLLGLYSKRAIAHERRQSVDQYTRTLDQFGNALRLLCGEDISFDVEIEPSFQPRLKAFGHNLDFSQLPDGVRSTVGWIADFMMRRDLFQWDARLERKRPGVVLLDEVDAHLHPLWQRKLLPAMRKALPDVQILVTSHSPFVISSCPNSRVHVLELDEKGHAHARPPVDSPIGESVTTTLKEIFGVESRFDVLTEGELDEWNALKKREAAGPLPSEDRSRLEKLTVVLASRSEELRSIVASPLTISENVLRSLTAGETKPHPIKRRRRA